MEIKMYNDTAWAAATVCDTKLELPVETEILIPDYLPQVFKIVKCFVNLVVLQKQVSGARLMVDGYLRLTVFYQSEGEDILCQTEQKLPFAKQIDLPNSEFVTCDITVDGDTEYINCRAVNQRRIDIRGAFALCVSAHAQSPGQIITKLEDGGVEQKMCTLSGMKTLAVQEKVITAEDTVEFDVPPESILDVKCTASVSETKIISGKAVVKGVINADILYKAQGLHHKKTTLTFNDVMELDIIEDGCENIAFAQPCGCTLLNADGGKISLTVTAVLYLKAYKQVQTQAVCDAFSTSYDTQLAFDTVYTEEKIDEFSTETEAVTEGNLPDADAEIVEVFATSTQPELMQEENTTSIRGRVVIHMFCKNVLGEIDCYDKACEYILPYTYEASKDELILTARADVLNVSAKKMCDTASAAVLINVKGLVTRRNKHIVLSQITCKEPLVKAQDNVALRIYYATSGEPLFDIARRYAVSPSSIAGANELEEEVVTQCMRLLVPSGLQ